MRLSHQEDRGTLKATHVGVVLMLVSALTTLAACGGSSGGTGASGVPPPVANDTGTFTFHVNPTGNDPTNEQLVAIGSPGQTSDRLSVLKDGTFLRVLVSDSAGAESNLGVSISDWQPGQTHTISFVWGGGVEQLYIDGKLAGQVDHPGVLQLPPEAQALNGSITDFQAFGRPLTPEEVARLAGTTVATSTPPIFATPARPPTSDVTLRVQSTTVAEPDSAGTVCVEMIGGTGFVAGTQNDLAWDLGCVEIGETCQANPQHGKSVFTKLHPGPSLRTLVFSFINTDPIDDGVLYCCPFHVASIPSGTCCPVRLQGVAASDSSGHLVLADGVDGQICLR